VRAQNKISPYNATKWSGEALRVAIGVVEVIFASLALCPYYTRLSAFVFSTMASMALYNTVQLKETANLVRGQPRTMLERMESEANFIFPSALTTVCFVRGCDFCRCCPVFP
jgi:uncharacterized membrane protein YphA (DoxX/SURF4 family)